MNTSYKYGTLSHFQPSNFKILHFVSMRRVYVSVILILLMLTTAATPTAGAGGRWYLVKKNIGIVAMHMQLLPTDRVVIYDRTSFGPSNISLPGDKCRRLDDQRDCTAHSVEYDVRLNTIRPLTLQTDVWCSSGSLMRDGTLVQTGGYKEGELVVRVLNINSDWKEIRRDGLVKRRWYATNHVLPEGGQIVIGGRKQFSYEFYPKASTGMKKAFPLRFLAETYDGPKIENNLYPFVFLNTDGSLFIFANNRAILFSYTRNEVVKRFPEIPGGHPRSYPSTGSAVLLPLSVIQGKVMVVEVMICGGAPKGSYSKAKNNTFGKALNSCARIKISDPDPKWVMERMPLHRVMGDMVLLPNGKVLIINGGSHGTAGWEHGRNPVLNPVIYDPIYSRFDVQNPTTIPRMYHSTAILVRDGRVLVGGSDPHQIYRFKKNVLFPTELRLEAFLPPYLDPNSFKIRPKIISPITQTNIRYGKQIVVKFMVQNKEVDPNRVLVTMVLPSFNTHSFSMNQRLLVLDGGNTTKSVGNMIYEVITMAPPSKYIAPSGYYMLFVVNEDIPSEGIWVVIG